MAVAPSMPQWRQPPAPMPASMLQASTSRLRMSIAIAPAHMVAAEPLSLTQHRTSVATPSKPSQADISRDLVGSTLKGTVEPLQQQQATPATPTPTPSECPAALRPLPRAWEDKYEVNADCPILGGGAFAEVFRVNDRVTKESFALKIMHRPNFALRGIERQIEAEVHAMRLAADDVEPGVEDHIVSLVDVVEENEYIFLLLGCCERGDLLQLLSRQPCGHIDEEIGAKWARELFLGLQKMHRLGVIHRDIKPDNLLCTEKDALKIADFGWCAEIREAPTSLAGTFMYMAPEVLRNMPQTQAVDIWSAGVTLYQLLTGQQLLCTYLGPGATNLSARDPHEATAVKQRWLLEEIASVCPLTQDLCPPFVSPQCWDFLKQLLVPEVSQRATVEEALGHPWVQNHAWEESDDNNYISEPACTKVDEPLSPIAASEPSSPFPNGKVAVQSPSTDAKSHASVEDVPTPLNPREWDPSRNIAYSPPLKKRKKEGKSEESPGNSTPSQPSQAATPSRTLPLPADESSPSTSGPPPPLSLSGPMSAPVVTMSAPIVGFDDCPPARGSPEQTPSRARSPRMCPKSGSVPMVRAPSMRLSPPNASPARRFPPLQARPSPARYSTGQASTIVGYECPSSGVTPTSTTFLYGSSPARVCKVPASPAFDEAPRLPSREAQNYLDITQRNASRLHELKAQLVRISESMGGHQQSSKYHPLQTTASDRKLTVGFQAWAEPTSADAIYSDRKLTVGFQAWAEPTSADAIYSDEPVRAHITPAARARGRSLPANARPHLDSEDTEEPTELPTREQTCLITTTSNVDVLIATAPPHALRARSSSPSGFPGLSSVQRQRRRSAEPRPSENAPPANIIGSVDATWANKTQAAGKVIGQQKPMIRAVATRCYAGHSSPAPRMRVDLLSQTAKATTTSRPSLAVRAISVQQTTASRKEECRTPHAPITMARACTPEANHGIRQPLAQQTPQRQTQQPSSASALGAPCVLLATPTWTTARSSLTPTMYQQPQRAGQRSRRASMPSTTWMQSQPGPPQRV
eukprot:gnl/TRDRNA2_/TRDRNA2_85190_c0_seq1.p1 gnl/TRDRNA2_/TRDRNA2_85190_c0~~gnl/TRDRNA2_/TRDRNA2_85190_c0_seq1.p1  ORF type:complete len:1077 (+),score=171.38 gnl/TRDRNA2_/TRDRNA2_85190_c0_seq1:124-3231(+)